MVGMDLGWQVRARLDGAIGTVVGRQQRLGYRARTRNRRVEVKYSDAGDPTLMVVC